MARRLPVVAAALLAALGPFWTPEARADRLGGNFRGPADRYESREDARAPAAPSRAPDTLLASLGLDAAFVSGLDAGRKEAAFRGRPLLVLFALPGSADSEAMAAALADAGRQGLLARFVPVVVDADREDAFGVARGLHAIPTLLILDASDRELARAEGAAGTMRVAETLRRAQYLAAAPRPTAEARAIEHAASHLARALKSKDWAGAIRAAAAIEKAGHEGPEAEDARRAIGAAVEEAAARIERARRLLGEGERTEARRTLVRVVREFDGLPEAADAAALLAELTAPGGTAQGLRGSFRPVGAFDPRRTGEPLWFDTVSRDRAFDVPLPAPPEEVEKPEPEPIEVNLIDPALTIEDEPDI